MSVVADAKRNLIIGKLTANHGMSLYKAMREVGYAHTTALSPKKNLGESFIQKLDTLLSDDKLLEVHDRLLHSTKIDHMVFPLGPKEDEDEPNDIEEGGAEVERTSLTDREITEMLGEINGTVRRIVHGQNARHVYFWVPNDKARQDALKLAYDLRGKLIKKEAPPAGDTYNTFVQQTNVNPNSPSSKELVQATLDVLMAKTKRKVVDV